MLNKVMIIGRLGRDPELRYTQTGIPVATMNVATDETFMDKDGNRQNKTEWHKIVVFQKQAENCERFLSKGSMVYVEGSLQTRKWQDAQGQDRYVTEIKGQRVLFLDKKGDRPGDYQEGYGRKGQSDQDRQPKNEGFDNWGTGPQEKQKQHGNDNHEDLGPAFPSETSSMDDMIF